MAAGRLADIFDSGMGGTDNSVPPIGILWSEITQP